MKGPGGPRRWHANQTYAGGIPCGTRALLRSEVPLQSLISHSSKCLIHSDLGNHIANNQLLICPKRQLLRVSQPLLPVSLRA